MRSFFAAIFLFIVLDRALLFAQSERPESSPDAHRLAVLNELWQSAQALRAAGKLDEQRSFELEVPASAAANSIGEGESRLLRALDLLAGFFDEAGDDQSLVRAREEIVRVTARVHGADHWRTVDARLAWDEARLLVRLSREQRDQLKLANDLNLQAIESFRMGQYAKARSEVERSAEVRRELLGETHHLYASNLNDLAEISRKMADYAGAETLFQQAIKVSRASYGERHPVFARHIANLAGLHTQNGDYRQAERGLLQALEIQRGALGPNDAECAGTLDNLGLLYLAEGDFARAEAAFAQALELLRQASGDQADAIRRVTSNLGVAYHNFGDFARAERCYREVWEMSRAALDKRHPSYAIDAHNLGDLYRHAGDLDRAEPLLLEAAEVAKLALGNQHPQVARFLNHLADLYLAKRDFAQAERLFLEALEIRRAVYGEQHVEFASGLNNLGVVYQAMGDNARAESHYMRALEIERALRGAGHAGSAITLHNLGGLYCGLGRLAEGLPLLRESMHSARRLLDQCAVVQSERQQMSLATALRTPFYLWLGAACSESADDLVVSENSPDSVYGEVLAWKGTVTLVQMQSRLAATLARNENPEVVGTANRYSEAARQLAAWVNQTPAPDQAEAYRNRLDVVVLSACQTGLGRSAEREGLLGLQRAFHIAGARTVVASLWSVSDDATQKLMVDFYDNLWNKQLPKIEALRQAQLAMLRDDRAGAGGTHADRGLKLADDHPPVNRRLPPYYWAAFVLSGCWQ